MRQDRSLLLLGMSLGLLGATVVHADHVVTVCMKNGAPRRTAVDATMTATNGDPANYLKVRLTTGAKNCEPVASVCVPQGAHQYTGPNACESCTGHTCDEIGAASCQDADEGKYRCPCVCTIDTIVTVGPLGSQSAQCSLCNCDSNDCENTCDNTSWSEIFCTELLDPAPAVVAISSDGASWDYWDTPMPIDDCGQWHSGHASIACVQEICCTASADLWPRFGR